MKIHCIESQREDFDNIPMKDIRKMIGWIEPPEDKKGTWDVNMIGESIFSCKNQETAQIIASLEEIKALLINQVEDDEYFP